MVLACSSKVLILVIRLVKYLFYFTSLSIYVLLFLTLFNCLHLFAPLFVVMLAYDGRVSIFVTRLVEYSFHFTILSIYLLV